MKLFRSTEFLGRLFQMQPGDVFSTEKLRNGLKNLTKVYSQFGYIDYVAEPQIDIVPNSNKINLTLNADEGKQFFVRRIDFTGNTTTRDKVIRREILIDEGDVYNSTLWDASILRLNQLGYFETLKENESYELKRNAGTNTVDINLKVKERGKNSIGLNGGVSGISGNVRRLELFDQQLPRSGRDASFQSQVGTLQDQITLGFTEPYLFDRPLQAGISVYFSRFNYDQGRQISLLSGVESAAFYNSLGSANVLNYIQNSKGISLSASYPIKRSFARLGISIGYDDSSIVTKSTGAPDLFHLPEFPGCQWPQCVERHQDAQHHAVLHVQLEEQLPESHGRKKHFRLDQGVGKRAGRERQHDSSPPSTASIITSARAVTRTLWRSTSSATTVTGYGGKVAPPFMRVPSSAAKTTFAGSISTASRRSHSSPAARASLS